MNRSSSKKLVLTKEASERIANTIQEAENRTSAEIKLVVIRHCWTDIKSKAAKIFKKYELGKTKQRNCVLVLLVTANREFLIYGDQGIHEKVGPDFWEDTSRLMMTRFKDGAFGDGICEAIKRVGEKLACHFAYQADDENEISNEVVHED